MQSTANVGDAVAKRRGQRSYMLVFCRTFSFIM